MPWVPDQREFRIQIDYDQLIWESLLDCQHSFRMPDFESRMSQGTSVSQSVVTMDRFEYNVNTLECYILPDWEDDIYKKDKTQEVENPWRRYRAIIRLLQRRNFFKRKEETELIVGKLPKEVTDLLRGQSTGSDKAKTVSSS